MSSRLSVIIVLGTTQTLAWASSYYLPAILADRIANDLGISSTWFFAAFSSSLVISALIGPRVGRTIDAIGGRDVLVVSNIVIAAGLVALALAHSQAILWFAWLVLGVGMGLGLYDTAFATLGRIYGTKARSAITGITLIAGFASTVGGHSRHGVQVNSGGVGPDRVGGSASLIGLPLNRFLIPKPSNIAVSLEANGKPHVPLDRTMITLGLAFACSWMVVAAMAVHLPRLLEAAGATSVEAVAAGALIGPAQVAARLAEASLLKHFHPLFSARLSVVLHPIGAGVLAVAGTGAAAGAFAVLHGAGSGILTIARGTVPLAIFGAENYGYRLGLLGAPSRIAMAAAPLLFGLMIEHYGAGVLIFSSALSLAALLGLCTLPRRYGLTRSRFKRIS